jgi:hypothetical protein
VRKYGKPDLFITMTCNPNWPEIKAALPEGQEVKDRPHLAVRVFHIKQQKLLEDLKGVNDLHELDKWDTDFFIQYGKELEGKDRRQFLERVLKEILEFDGELSTNVQDAEAEFDEAFLIWCAKEAERGKGS